MGLSTGSHQGIFLAECGFLKAYWLVKVVVAGWSHSWGLRGRQATSGLEGRYFKWRHGMVAGSCWCWAGIFFLEPQTQRPKTVSRFFFFCSIRITTALLRVSCSSIQKSSLAFPLLNKTWNFVIIIKIIIIIKQTKREETEKGRGEEVQAPSLARGVRVPSARWGQGLCPPP